MKPAPIASPFSTSALRIQPGRTIVPLARLAAVASFLISAGISCERASTGVDSSVTTLGTIEVTARLVEVPRGAIFQRDLYHYATVLEYEVLQVHRGKLDLPRILVGHYDPWKPRWKAADDRVRGIGGDLDAFRAGDVHRMALEASIDDHYMGGIVNKYFETRTGPIHWAVWTNRVSQ